MKTSINRLPEEKQHEITTIVDLILEYPAKKTIYFIILFGSYARNDWVEDWYVEDGITYRGSVQEGTEFPTLPCKPLLRLGFSIEIDFKIVS